MSAPSYGRANMPAVGERSFIDVAGGRIEVDIVRGEPDLRPLVFLHEGLGSIDLWRGFPEEVGALAGSPTVIVYSRHGYGRSDSAPMPRPAEYMHHEADVVLPEILAALAVELPVLVGHSDGASIALLHAGDGHPVAGVVCLAAHVFVEPESIAGIEAARDLFADTDMVDRMALYHDDPTATFRGWNDVWLSPEFRSWNIEDRLPGITAPTLVVQGTDDQYGTVAQVAAIEAGVSGPCERMIIPGAGHAPHLEARNDVAERAAEFVTSCAGNRAQR